MQSNEDLIGRVIGHITITGVVGAGGMGKVYTGFDTTLKRPVAVKAILGVQRFSAENRARFLREARILSQLNHPRICQINDYVKDEEGDQDFLIMELIEGESLREVMRSDRLRFTDKLDISKQLLEVLEVGHAQGIIHRDLNPENINVTLQEM